jgi:hypothetical protein
MTKTAVMMQVMLQAKVEVDIPSPEEMRQGTQWEVRFDASSAKMSQMHAVFGEVEPSQEDGRAAAQLALMATLGEAAKQVLAETERQMRERRASEEPTVFTMPEGQA